ncbi:MAG: hypothetical protein RL425_787 [Pseudomonadota bacterium]|jgi:hypothetical protein
MDLRSLKLFLPVIAALLVSSPHALAQEMPPSQTQLAQLVIERRVVIRVVPHEDRAQMRPNFRDWREKSASRCLYANDVVGVLITKPDSIDLVLRGRHAMRARLERGCRSIDFYSGFYFKPTPDGRLCEDRDMIYSRAGGACTIDRYNRLVPPKR